MTFQGNPESLPFFLAAAVSAVLAVVAALRRGKTTAPAFAAMMVGETAWALCEALELVTVELPIKRVWFALRVVGAVTAILGLFAFVLIYTGRSRWLAMRRFGVVCAAQLALVLAAWTNPWHHLYWARIWNEQIGRFWIAMPAYGPLFRVHVVFSYSLIALAILLLTQAVFRSVGIYRVQAAVMLFGAVFPWVVNIIDLSQLFGYIHVDTVAMTFTVTGLALLPSLFRFRLLDLIPVARTRVVEEMDDPVVVLDSALRVADLNTAAERLLARPIRALLGVDVASAFPAWPALVERLGHIEEAGESTFELDGPEGAGPLAYDARISRLEGNDRPAGWVIVLRDITDRKRALAERAKLLEEEAARAEAEAANRAKDAFLGILSHELRTPLTPVLAAVTSLLDDDATPAAFQSTLAMIRRNVLLESRMIDDLLDLTRISRGKLQLSPEVVDVHAAVREALEICANDLQDRNVHVDLSARAHHVDADHARLLQVFWNLLKNAAKFTPAGGSITVRSRNLENARRTRARTLVLEFNDTGVGISPAVLPRIFDAFEQAEGAKDRRLGGLGLGLAISRWLIEAHGGRLGAASAGEGRGATFTIELATVREPSLHAAAPSPTGTRLLGRPQRILLVEDDADTRSVLSSLLERGGFLVGVAADVGSALERARSEEFDLLICDLKLPDGSGLELLRELRARRTKPIPAIAVTGYGMDDDIKRSQAEGFADHLTKPLDMRKLEASIRQITLLIQPGGETGRFPAR
jgi:signal transduction histidine kinase/ActR/RegA family two-component response regulator